MAVGSPESFTFHVAFLIGAIIVWAVILRLFKMKSMALPMALGYLTLAAYGVIFEHWNPLAPLGFSRDASEIVALSWPATLLQVKLKLKSDMSYFILLAATAQYCAGGWIIDLLSGSIFGKDN
jgi:hypothetical protein